MYCWTIDGISNTYGSIRLKNKKTISSDNVFNSIFKGIENKK
jgi:hypothetical protein